MDMDRGRNMAGDDDVIATNNEVLRRMAVAIPDIVENSQAAKTAADQEQRMGLIESAKLYPKAILFSMIMSLGIVMEGYDTALLGNFYAQPAFQHKFGNPVGDGTYQVTAPWQAGLSNGANVGEILGLFGAGMLAESSSPSTSACSLRARSSAACLGAPFRRSPLPTRPT
ncbi:hypothetical protein NQ176_g11121 [Zarea fungicola]|uniref:Uncharacterized protein n=1 Tax=Zarea fungicola TaxID=93591 RepID=A0ACC1MBY7_9HYPO|nr:hypothetical protein NQ176_g11121 [Lecanicillium fungicola]